MLNIHKLNMMMMLPWFIVSYFVLFMSFAIAKNTHRHPFHKHPMNYPTIYVDPSGHGNFSTIQSAINSVPANNKKWICVYIKAGVYREQVIIPYGKPFIYLKGEGKRKTSIVWGAGGSIVTSATFSSNADDIVAKSLTFINSFNYPPNINGNDAKQAVAALIAGDRSAFYRCQFFGLQDTLWDVQGRHYFRSCTIQGAVDFIFGAGQSIYEGCNIFVLANDIKAAAGVITAQGRSSPIDPSGFVFKGCNVVGTGPTLLGRPWRQYARVIFYNTTMSKVIVPQGWDAWNSRGGGESLLTFAESDCKGPGSNTSNRVQWEAKLSQATLQKFISMSFIDSDGWIRRQPFNMLG